MPAVRLSSCAQCWRASAVTALPGPAIAAPNDEVFTVGNYPVDAGAANAVAAKQKAMADGQQAAFRSWPGCVPYQALSCDLGTQLCPLCLREMRRPGGFGGRWATRGNSGPEARLEPGMEKARAGCST